MNWLKDITSDSDQSALQPLPLQSCSTSLETEYSKWYFVRPNDSPCASCTWRPDSRDIIQWKCLFSDAKRKEWICSSTFSESPRDVHTRLVSFVFLIYHSVPVHHVPMPRSDSFSLDSSCYELWIKIIFSVADPEVCSCMDEWWWWFTTNGQCCMLMSFIISHSFFYFSDVI